MRIISLKEFFQTGHFGPISIGQHKSELIEAFGEEFEFADCGETHIIRYGWYEFFYWTNSGKIFGIQNDHLQADTSDHAACINFFNKDWILDKWFLRDNRNISLKEVEKVLRLENIVFNLEQLSTVENESIITNRRSLVSMDFHGNYRRMEYDELGEFIKWNEYSENDYNNFVLNGIRIFKY